MTSPSLAPDIHGGTHQEAGMSQSTLAAFFHLKEPLRPARRLPSFHPDSATLTSIPKKSSKAANQLRLTHLPLLHTCRECQMSYVRGGEDDGLHAKHHERVVRGIMWDGLGNRGQTSGVRVIEENALLGSHGRGRIISVEGSHGGTRLIDVLNTVDTALSSPALPQVILEQCKIFLFVTKSPPPSAKRIRILPTAKQNSRERVVAVVVAQKIKWALRVLRTGEAAPGTMVDSGGGVICDPTRLPTPLGMHRLFTVPSYRSLGLARLLLDAACQHTVYGCHFDPLKGDVAFSQPTQSGRAVMERWGGGHVRVFVDDESQL